jgi:hypothetical protein
MLFYIRLPSERGAGEVFQNRPRSLGMLFYIRVPSERGAGEVFQNRHLLLNASLTRGKNIYKTLTINIL